MPNAIGEASSLGGIGIGHRVQARSAFDANRQAAASGVIKQHFNQPSICLWSLYNALNPAELKRSVVKQVSETERAWPMSWMESA